MLRNVILLDLHPMKVDSGILESDAVNLGYRPHAEITRDQLDIDRAALVGTITTVLRDGDVIG